ncbi:MAG TPA: UDP-glucose 4-epimerase [Kosmotogaceae bacterium]|nr:MAG: NAD-dependent epimerase/dehydratase [Thermotogales bacterium 46_20]HAA85804.1 UDP-glucose 4-epimerase [Kosmotogaceae bacterium]
MADNILVTGGAGFIGSHVVDKLIERNMMPIVVDDLSSGKLENLDPKALFYHQDINDEEMMERVFRIHRPRYVFHLAAQISVSKSVREPLDDAMMNIIGTLKLLELATANGAEKFIFSSTGGAIYGDDVSTVPTPETEPANPCSPYGIAKLSVDHYLRFYSVSRHLTCISLRYGNVYGPRQDPDGEAGVVAIFAKGMIQNDTVRVFGDGENVRDYVYVEDVAEANVNCVTHEDSDIFNIGTGIGTTVNRLFETMAKVSGYDRKPVYEEPRPGDLRVSILNSEKAQEKLKWRPKVCIEDGLVKTIDFFREELDTSE